MQPRFGGFWVRAVACTLDWVVLTIASTLVQIALTALYYAFRGLVGGWDALPGFWAMAFSDAFWAQTLNAVLYLGFGCAYYGVGVARYGTTLGKSLFRMEVVRSGSGERLSVARAIGRHLASLVSLLPFGAGYLMVMFHPEKRSLHDLIAGTVVLSHDRPRNLETSQ